MTTSAISGAVAVAGRPGATAAPGGTVVVTGLASDAHTWNLVYLHLIIEELGHRVVNLGSCVPEDELVAACLAHRPAMVVVSSVNGHGHQDGLRAIRGLRAVPQLVTTPVVIGGKLGVNGPGDTRQTWELLAAGFDAVFEDGADAETRFRSFLSATVRAAL
ncbi:cobalamin B12-binding domain-containing protein [Streptomyces sp. NBC_01217]|uniref:cobalamin B12-binding domain-containing protein n=1 Tax=Streptomyces sp. NBC_01217 TaxID=2903779 RepID=UPI002E0F3AE9|nr:cobalamin-dependent protein [Streptomyces sp. NBC_01217]WSQ55750.1 cobalamin-dependent protein [Streptomyces sp. NBC_01217]